MVRGDLPELNGHCVDGARTRVTITSLRDVAGQMVWQVGGQVAEDGVQQEPLELLRHARDELQACLPGMRWDGLEWGTYRVSRAEGKMPGARRPDNEVALQDGNVWSAWPTKLALAPRLANLLGKQLPTARGGDNDWAELSGWARPPVADGPWEEATWHREL